MAETQLETQPFKTVRFDSDLHYRLRILAARQSTTITELLDTAVTTFLGLPENSMPEKADARNG